MKKVLVITGILIIAWVIASPYITVYQMKSAADNQDGEALSEYVEFATLRQNFKDQLNVAVAKETSKETDDNPFAAFGAALGSLMVDRMVDAYVTPAAITEMMKGEKPKSQSTKSSETNETEENPFEDANLSYESWDKFTVSVPDDEGGISKFVLRRRGIGWKLTNIIIPLEN